ncbi:hypothetical protein C7212DRAFT_348442 [Tuber magnatum]|uniref:ORC1/DEAH AAA+ ATPase domain-containing protein n=1 Tax=Tuber magnatum TaxID=42249 RepID=A0A317SCN8_9PEZI|nr:hypothetical protein C7212DRAFT_348442 [Tuber magnatum]
MGAVPDAEGTKKLVEHPGATWAIEYILKPQSDYAYYDMIIGTYGTGKTTLVRHVAHQLDGVLYVNISPKRISEKTFAKGFVKAFHWTPSTCFWFDMLLFYGGISAGEAAAASQCSELSGLFVLEAKLFKQNKGQPPVLVLDNVNCLAQDNPKLLNILQDITKDVADDGLCCSASSCLAKAMEIGDLEDNEAMDFLCNKRGITEPVARDIYGLVGGCVVLLARAANELNSGQDIPGLSST